MQQSVLVRGQVQCFTVLGDVLGNAVEFHVAHGDDRVCLSGRAPNQRLDPGRQLFVVKGLGEIIVGTRFQSLDLVLPAIARSQD